MSKRFNNAIGPNVRASKKTHPITMPLVVLAIFAIALWSGTQFFAYQTHFHPRLGWNFHGAYPFWRLASWAWDWYEWYPKLFIQAGSIAGVVCGLGFVATLIAMNVHQNTAKANVYLHGSARWAEEKDIKGAGLLTEEGVYVGGWVDPSGRTRYLRHDGPEHILTYAPTRSGKGVSLVLPTLLSWRHSAVITDLKGELWAMTAGWRKKHAANKVLKFEPASMNGSVAWNALSEIRVGTESEVGDVQNLATLLVDPDGKGLESHWQKTSQALLVGVILHSLYVARADGSEPNLTSVDRLLSDPNRDVRELWMEMTTYGHVDGRVHPVIGQAGRDMLDRPDEEAGSVLSTAKSYLSLYRDPVVAHNTRTCQFRIKDLMNHRCPVSLYIVTEPTDKNRLRPLVRVMLNMIIRLLADKMKFELANGKEIPPNWWERLLGSKGKKSSAYVQTVKGYRHRMLLLLDEFPALGKLEILQESLAFIAGYGLKAYLICQDINQLKSKETGYGPDETITSNCHVQNAFPPNRVETAEYLSKQTGQTTVIKEQVTTSGKRAGFFHGQVSRTTQEVQRPLLTPDECQRMKGPIKDSDDDQKIVEPGDMVVYVAGNPAIYGRQTLYFQDDTFIARAAVPAPTISDTIRSHAPTGAGV